MRQLPQDHAGLLPQLRRLARVLRPVLCVLSGVPGAMKKQIKYVGVGLATVVLGIATAVIVFAPPAFAAGTTCWQVDCNTCCKTNGKTICTLRACL
jgi:hypothetical protein